MQRVLLAVIMCGKAYACRVDLDPGQDYVHYSAMLCMTKAQTRRSYLSLVYGWTSMNVNQPPLTGIIQILTSNTVQHGSSNSYSSNISRIIRVMQCWNFYNSPQNVKREELFDHDIYTAQ